MKKLDGLFSREKQSFLKIAKDGEVAVECVSTVNIS